MSVATRNDATARGNRVCGYPDVLLIRILCTTRNPSAPTARPDGISGVNSRLPCNRCVLSPRSPNTCQKHHRRLNKEFTWNVHTHTHTDNLSNEDVSRRRPEFARYQEMSHYVGQHGDPVAANKRIHSMQRSATTRRFDIAVVAQIAAEIGDDLASRNARQNVESESTRDTFRLA